MAAEVCRPDLDAELVEKAVNGDRQAFGQLVERHYDFVHAVAWRWSGNVSDAEDIAQEVCLRLGSAIRGFRGTSRFRTRLYTLTLNAARDHKRRQARDDLVQDLVRIPPRNVVVDPARGEELGDRGDALGRVPRPVEQLGGHGDLLFERPLPELDGVHE